MSYIDERDPRTQPFTAAEFGNAWAVHRGEVFKTHDLSPFQREWAEWLVEHDAKVRAEEREKYDPAKDERLARYMALVTPLGYASALEAVNSLTAMLNVESRAGEIAEKARQDEREKCARIAESAFGSRYSEPYRAGIAARIREQGEETNQ